MTLCNVISMHLLTKSKKCVYIALDAKNKKKTMIKVKQRKKVPSYLHRAIKLCVCCFFFSKERYYYYTIYGARIHNPVCGWHYGHIVTKEQRGEENKTKIFALNLFLFADITKAFILLK